MSAATAAVTRRPARSALPDAAGLAGMTAEAGDRGSLTLLLAVLFVALLALAGLVVDGGAKLDANQKAIAVAQEAARAGAGMVNTPAVYAGRPITVSPGQALLAARRYLVGAGYPGSQVRLVGTNAIQVTVTIHQPTVMLSLIGLNAFTVRGTATASLVSGVTGPGR
jgi:hypothetical protein